MSERKIIVIPDVHSGFKHANIAALNEFLHSLKPQAQNLRFVFLGDLLDLWRARPEACLKAAQPIFEALRELTQGRSKVDYIIGNHDFHLLIDLRRHQSIVRKLPKFFLFFHRYLLIKVNGKRILLCHGDDYDFRYLPLEVLDPFLPGDFTAHSVHAFYEWCYRADKRIIGGWDKGGLRGVFLKWLEVKFAFSKRRRAASAAVMAHAFASARRSEAAVFGLSVRDWIDDLLSTSLEEVHQRTPAAMRWREIENYAPFPTRRDIRRFGRFDHLIVGHFHSPRQKRGVPVTDAGSWVSDPTGKLVFNTFVEIEGNAVSLFQYAPNEPESKHLLSRVTF